MIQQPVIMKILYPISAINCDIVWLHNHYGPTCIDKFLVERTTADTGDRRHVAFIFRPYRDTATVPSKAWDFALLTQNRQKQWIFKQPRNSEFACKKKRNA